MAPGHSTIEDLARFHLYVSALVRTLKTRLAEEWSDCNLELLCQRRCTPRIRLYSTETLAYGPPHVDPGNLDALK